MSDNQLQKVRSSDRWFLSIAATDTTGEAGITKDCKIASNLGFNTLTAVTAVTVQNDAGLHKLYPVPDSALQEQLQVCSTYPVDCIKIGALGSSEQSAVISGLLTLFPDAVIIWDPVFAPSKGKPFVHKSDIADVAEVLLPRIDILTPNYRELLQIMETDSQSIEEIIPLIRDCAAQNNTAFFITGGHFPAETDNVLKEVFVDKERVVYFEKKKTDFAYDHGTGCTFSTALACFMITTGNTLTACRMSTEFVDMIYA